MTEVGAAVGGRWPIELVGVGRWYGNVVAVNDVSLRIGAGITGLLGPNGAGKTTLLHLVAGFLRPSVGRVLVDGEPPHGRPAVWRSIGFVPELEAIPTAVSGAELVEIVARLHRLPDPPSAADRVLELVDLGAARHRPIGTYSKGMRTRVKLAAALVHDPAILLLDEPFNGLDPRGRIAMIDLLRELAAQGRTIVFSSHILEEVERLAERIVVVYAGRLAAAGDFRAIRRLMIDRPHTFTVRSSDDRRLGAALLRAPAITGVELADGRLVVRSSDYGAVTRLLPDLARAEKVSLFEVRPTDESLDRVFEYLVRR
ncbi:MAG TPA: ABC transporter ATP-binding protein [Candidatus Binatia bacterium]|nr:ABC transporter ATP-binding protein [Candidatus Binatia bacterium]